MLAGAESYMLHLTASWGDKGKRADIAIQKPYQEHRKGKPKPKYLSFTKNWMHTARKGIMHEDQEADDGLCQALHNAKDKDLAVITSKDKDLCMCTGWQMDWETGDLEYVNGFGYINLDASGLAKKITGKGTKFFWAQMLMGDVADNIAGLPVLLGKHMNKYKPTKAIIKAREVLGDFNATDIQTKKAIQVLEERKNSTCGAVTAYNILKDTPNDLEAARIVQQLYKDVGEQLGYKHHKTGEDVDYLDVFFSEAKLLWMRRKPSETDFNDFLMGLSDA